MVDALFLLRAMDGIGDRELLLTRDFLELGEQSRRRSGRKLWRTVLIAALLALLLAACGYAVYHATMSHRELHRSDENSYYLDIENNGPEGGYHLELNHGTCAMALHFDTEETGCLYGFRITEDAPIDPAWRSGGTTLKTLFRTYEPGGPRPAEQQRSLEQCLQDAGLTEAEAENCYCSMTFSDEALFERPAMRIEVLDGPRLHGIDLILGWPEGEATVVREETQGELQILEVLIETPRKDGGTEKTLFFFRFDTRRQVLLSVAGAGELLDFPTLEAIAACIELYETDFVYSLDHSGQNFSVHSLAYG